MSKSATFAVFFILLGISANIIHRSFHHIEVKYYVVGSDMEGYYQYLPFFFLHDWEDFNHLPWAKPYEEGKTLNVYTCGVAIMQAPFFLMAHGSSLFFQLEIINGYGPVYYVFVFFASLFYALLGLIFIYKALKRIYDSKTAFWVAMLVFYATNLFYYTIVSPGMSHAYSFCLIAAFIYMVPVYFEKPNLKNAVFVSFPLALAILIRPTNIIAGLYFLFYNVQSWKTFKLHITGIVKKWYLIVAMACVAFIVMIPQLAYWHFVTGKFIYYSYQDEGFPFILSPHIGTVLFGARNGWFIYTPLMLIASIGLLFMVFKRYKNAWPILLVIILIVYINGSWWVPTFSAAAGYRAMIEFIPFMAIPLAFVFNKVFNSQFKQLKWVSGIILIILIFYNIQFSFKYSSWLWWDTDWQWDYLLRIFQF